ncbi:PREDICTED: solute carrier family 12 member 2 [Nicrophorus vespilloides]|uniref:Solute carrier family 12 member 2 n=1 Tax=Nicrophorus vespilloides TaxID=110193 RepID=A0ABM1MTR8_NICVS|nr:PREDICTED: solute carrier family 12 member 2 [Nicrophorus vespilloides]
MSVVGGGGKNGDLVRKSQEGLEMDAIAGDEKRTRFQVNRVRNETPDDTVVINVNDDNVEDNENLLTVTDRTRLNSDTYDTKYVKSFRHLTREALPRLDNYRNILSLQAANRPTLDELHNATLPNKGQQNPAHGLNGKDEGAQVKFGWIQGVLVRCLLNIWGVMLFLRLSWVVAQAGVGQAILLILTTTAVTTITSLSMSAISTNGVIKGGGTYYMISRSLGPEFGGSIGLIFSMANAVACAMYVVGFCESIMDLLKSFGLFIVDGGVQDVRIIGSITIIILLVIVVVGMEWEAKAQMGLLVILLIAIVDFMVGSVIPPSDEAHAKGFVGYNLTVFMENIEPDYRVDENGVTHNFFSVFAIFFPAATGILAGANISGDLRDPQSAIPKGTILAIAVTTFSYIVMAIVCGFTVVRDATGNIEDFFNGTFRDCAPGECLYGSQNSFQVIELVSWIGPIIYAGCFAATLSSALASLVSAPKVFQALCKDKLYPKIEWFAKGYGQNNEPVRGYILTFIIAVAFILIGELNLIAPLISNFFLAAYTLINFSTFHASLAKPVGWRPTFKYYNMWLSLLGSILCVLVMFLISWWTALLTLAVVLALYLIVAYRKPDVNWGSTTQAQIYKNALQTVHQLNNVEEHVKNYRPQILVLSGMPSARPSLVDFANMITKNISLLVCGHINTSVLHQRVRSISHDKALSWLKTHKLKAFYMQVDGCTFEEGSSALLKACGIGKLRPNILLVGHKSDWQKCSRDDLNSYFEVLHNALDLHMGVGILRLQTGLDFSQQMEDEQNNGSSIPRNQSYSHLSQGSSCSDVSVPATPLSRSKDGAISSSPNAEEESLKKKKIIYDGPDATEELPKEILSQMFQFQKKQKRGGTIDVWWLYDDGGLTLLLPYIISTRRNWSNCKLRVFALANKRDELEFEHRNMASLLAKFRIDYSDLQVVPDITSKPAEQTQQFFDSLIADFRVQTNKEDPDSVEISDAELLAVKDKTNRHLRLRELMLEHSHEANLVVMTLPMPRKNIVSAPLYLAWLELLTRDMPPILLVRGNQTSVLTFYS